FPAGGVGPVGPRGTAALAPRPTGRGIWGLGWSRSARWDPGESHKPPPRFPALHWGPAHRTYLGRCRRGPTDKDQVMTAQNRAPRAKLWLDSVWRALWEKAWGLLPGPALWMLFEQGHLRAAGCVGTMARARPASGSCVGHGVLHVSGSALSSFRALAMSAAVWTLQAQMCSSC
ncbi:unnamed protein product, partial [Gulo gulo]